MTKKEALLKLRLDPQFMICPYNDYMRLVRHLGIAAEYTQVELKGAPKITALKHEGRFFIPCTDEDLTNCRYDPKRIKMH